MIAVLRPGRTVMMGAIVGALSLTLPDGRELHASTDLGLAWLWAEHEVEGWEGLPPSARYAHVSAALAELRRAAQ